ncbi:NADH:flavin oxidoreductase [Haliangium sp.]|uniref:oxidoreductase n=1 Tax=Haliangium sp. TaxID=2663208 RepID=UPI003D13FF3E
MWQPPERIKHALPETRWPSAAEAAEARLFRPIRIGAIEAEQRTWVPAMVPWRASADGVVTDDVRDWYRRFAEGRPGVIVVEATGIRDIPSGPLLRIGHDRFVPGLRRLVETVREASQGHTRLFIQCIDFLTIRRRPPRDKYLTRFLVLTPGHRARLAELTGDPRFGDPDARDDGAVRVALIELADRDRTLLDQVLTAREREDLDMGYRERVTDTHLDHIRDLPARLPDLFAAAAERAVAAGFDGVELHYAHAYTMASFLSARNTRDDGYGRDRAGRVRLPLEVIAAVRARVGAEPVVGVRYLGDEVIAGGSGVDDAVYFGQRFAAAGVDFLSISTGGKFDDAKQPKVGEAAYPYTGRSGYECMPTVYSDQRGPFGRNVPLAAAVRRGLRNAGHEQPVVTAGGIATFEQAEAILARGEADIIAAARQSLADPDWFRKIELGRGDEIRRCEFTNYCEALDQKHRAVTCKLWDRVDLDQPGVTRDPSRRRRLVAPPWRPARAGAS